MSDDFNAAALRTKATGNSNLRALGAMNRIRKAASNAANEGECAVSLDMSNDWLPYAIRDTVKQQLEALGFAVSYFDDQREGSSITVRW
jgi:hypothetical protein